MKVTIDLDKLLEEGRISQAEYDKFTEFSARDTAALAFNVLIGFGVIAVSGAALALLPSPVTAVVLGLVIFAFGLLLSYAGYERWMVLAKICVLVGSLLFGGGVVTHGEGSISSFSVVTVTSAAAGILARSSLLIVLAVLSLSSCLGVRTGYFEATYFLGIQEPTLTVALFTIFSLLAYQLSSRVTVAYQTLAVAASRTGVFLVNFGFWIGSLGGDRMGEREIVIADWVFAVFWALALIATGAWAWKRNRRWLINVAAVFGAIHFYTQWFERLGASAETVLIAGLLALVFAIGLRSLNAKLSRVA